MEEFPFVYESLYSREDFLEIKFFLVEGLQKGILKYI